MKHTTLNEILKHNPCKDGRDMLLASLNKILADDEPLSFKYILKSNGIKDAVWALCVLDYKDQALFRADVAELVLPIFEKEYPDDDRPRKAVESIRDFYHGKINKEQLENAAESVYGSVCDARDSRCILAAYASCYAANFSRVYGSYDTAWHAAQASDGCGKKIEQLFIKYYC